MSSWRIKAKSVNPWFRDENPWRCFCWGAIWSTAWQAEHSGKGANIKHVHRHIYLYNMFLKILLWWDYYIIYHLLKFAYLPWFLNYLSFTVWYIVEKDTKFSKRDHNRGRNCSYYSLLLPFHAFVPLWMSKVWDLLLDFSLHGVEWEWGVIYYLAYGSFSDYLWVIFVKSFF